MSILFGLPMYGGRPEGGFFESWDACREDLLSSNLDFDADKITNESAVHRARNIILADFLESRFQKLMFIDADICNFTAHDIARLWNINSGQAGITAGVYPMKKLGAPYAAWRDGTLVDPTEHNGGPFEVDYAGTGFMMIDKSVFTKIIQKNPGLEYTGAYEDGTFRKMYQVFRFPLVKEEDGTVIELSEDYNLCKMWRELGGKVMVDPAITLYHEGKHRFGREHGKEEKVDESGSSEKPRRGEQGVAGHSEPLH